MADKNGNIFDDPRLLMVVNRAGAWRLPTENELIPLPRESELFLLPNRRAAGLNPQGEIEPGQGNAVAAFIAPGHTLDATPVYFSEKDAPILPLFAYGAVGYAKGRFWVCAQKVDNDPRQQFGSIKKEKIEKEASRLSRQYPENRLVQHIINNCVRVYACPAARNFALGRYEAPLPTSRSCNAACIGCISAQTAESPIKQTPQCRLAFTPSPEEIAEVMAIHEKREKNCPIYSFGQGCEGDPLANVDLLARATQIFRAQGGKGTINCNTNGSQPEAIKKLADAGLTSLRISLNSFRAPVYAAYYRPHDYSLEDVFTSMREARERNIFVSLNLLYFPGLTDCQPEIDALASLCEKTGVSMIQLRNLNIDPEWYAGLMQEYAAPAVGLKNFMKQIRKKCPWLRFGYFNPWLGEKAQIIAPMPC